MKNEISQAAASLGSIKTPKKSAASRENGKKGGRPKYTMTSDFFKGKKLLVRPDGRFEAVEGAKNAAEINELERNVCSVFNITEGQALELKVLSEVNAAKKWLAQLGFDGTFWSFKK